MSHRANHHLNMIKYPPGEDAMTSRRGSRTRLREMASNRSSRAESVSLHDSSGDLAWKDLLKGVSGFSPAHPRLRDTQEHISHSEQPPGLLPLDGASQSQELDLNDVCASMMESDKEILLCGVSDLSANRLLGIHHPDPNVALVFSSLLLRMISDAFSSENVLHCGRLLSSEDQGMPAIEESFFRTPGALYYLKRIPTQDVVVALCTSAHANLGLGWSLLKRFSDHIKARLLVVSS